MQQFLHAFSRTTCRQQIFHFDDCKARKEMRKDRGRTISAIWCGRLRWSYQDDEFREQAESWEGMLWLRIRIICGSGFANHRGSTTLMEMSTLRYMLTPAILVEGAGLLQIDSRLWGTIG